MTVLSCALLVLLAGVIAHSRTSRPLSRAVRGSQKAHPPKALPLSAPSARLDRSNPAIAYQTAMWSGTSPNQQSLVYTKMTQVTLPLDYKVQTVFDPQLSLGTKKVTRQGVQGQAVETVRHVYDGSREVSVSVVGEVMVHPPRSELVAVGAKLPEVSRGDILGRVAKQLSMVATAYWADPSWSNGFTATGVRARYGIIAVDPGVIPLGTRLYVPGYGYGVAADTGGAIKGDRIDLCFDTGQQAMDWGRQPVTIYELSK